MNRSLIIIFILLKGIVSAFSQETQLTATNQPLNKVLNMLGVEISFDDKALSIYKMSVSRKFRNPEEALNYLLNGKPFRIEKSDNVYIIVSTKKVMNNNNPIVWADENKEQFIFTGKVSDQQTQEPLCYATVCLLNSDSQPLITGITNDDGVFRFTTSLIPQKIKISFLGYETLFKDIRDLNCELGLFSLSTDPIQLEEAVVKADDIRYKTDRISYTITSQMIEGVFNAEELLNKIPGIQFDRLSNDIKINNSKEVLLLIDGIQQPAEYIRALSPLRISAVEVINEPSGRFVSDGYTSIINFILKKDYCGYDIYTSNFMAVNTSGTNGEDWLTEEQPHINLNLTNNKFNIFGTYSYHRDRWNLPVSKELTYNGVKVLSTQVSPDNPNDSYKRQSNNLIGGVNYQITPHNMIGIQGDYTTGNTFTNQVFETEQTNTAYQIQYSLINSTENKLKDNTLVGTLFYQGRINNRLQLYSDLSYNYYYNDIKNTFTQTDTLSYPRGNQYNEYKNHAIFNLEGQYLFSSQTSINIGYSNVYRKYGSESSHGRGFLDYQERRNRGFAYLLFNPSTKLNFKLGSAAEQVIVHNRNITDSYWRILPYAQINFKSNKVFNLNASYTTNQHYPLLYQLSPMSLVINNFLAQIGNPELKSAITHAFAIKVSLWDRLTITPMYHFIHDEISEIYTQKEFQLYRTFNNIDTKEYSIQTAYNQPIGKYFNFKNQVIYYYNEAPDAEIRNTPSGWLVDAEINFYHPQKNIGLLLGYHRNMKKQVLYQGYQMFDKDNWIITANKEFWNKRISVNLSYIPPVSLGIRYDQSRVLETSLYQEKLDINLKSYNNMILLKVNIRFGHDRSKPIRSRTSIQKDEREKQTIELQ